MSVQVPDMIELLAACKAAYHLGRGSVSSRLSQRKHPHERRKRSKNTKRVVEAIRKETDYPVPRYDSPARRMLFAAFDIGLYDQQEEEETT